MTDKITPTATLASLDVEATPEPYVFGLGSHLVRFPDPMDMDFEEADEFLSSVRSTGEARVIFKRWLSEEDYKVLADAHLKGRQAAALLRDVLRHYELLLGTQGEDNTSGTA